MRKHKIASIVGGIIGITLICVPCHAELLTLKCECIPTNVGKVELKWDRPVERCNGDVLLAEDIASYELVFGPTQHEMKTSVLIDGKETSTVIRELEPGKLYFFSIKTIDTEGRESIFSEAVSKLAE